MKIVLLLKNNAQIVFDSGYLPQIRIYLKLEEGSRLPKMINGLLLIIKSPIIRPKSLVIQPLLIIIDRMLLLTGIQPQLQILNTLLIVLQSPSLPALLHISRTLLYRRIL